MGKTAAKVLDTTKTATTNTRRKRATTAPPPVSEVRAVAAPPSHDDIRARAYELYLARGGQHGHAADDWARAEAELTSRA